MLPNETIAAMFPYRVASHYGLQPVTLSHVAAMEAFGVDLDGRINEGNAFIAGWILSLEADDVAKRLNSLDWSTRDFKKWALKVRLSHALKGDTFTAMKLAKAVNRHLEGSFVTLMEGERAQNEIASAKLMRTGLGWVLELAEWYSHEYSQPFDEAMKVPIIRILALVACSRQRNGMKHGSPDYFERMDIDKTKAQLGELKARMEGMKNGKQ